MAIQQPTLGEKIRESRLARDITLRELARRLEITPSYLSDIENDRRVPAEGILKLIAGALEIPLDELMALAGRFGDATERYLKKTPIAGTLFRRISEANLQPEDLKKLLEETEFLERGEKK